VIVVASWIQQSASRGILTSRYPKEAASEEEVPATGRPPLPVGGPARLAEARSSCPVGAISDAAVDQGKCVRCARCLGAGLAFVGTVEAATRSRADLLQISSDPTPLPAPPPPLTSLGRSLHIFLVDVGSCNACNLEVLALANPYYDSQRVGLFFTNSPRHADVLLVVGVPTPEMTEPLRRAYEALPGPKAVVAVGACPISGGVFAGAPGLAGSLEEIVPVDVFVPGCPPSPISILDALLKLNGRDRAARGGR
jgi:Ni,Fe-hydrogenase III small subunit